MIHLPPCRSRGLTLFELGVVVLIAVILLIVSVYSLRGFVVRTKWSRVKEDQRVLSRALQNYIMDYSSLPALDQGLRPLVQPTAYLGALPRDPFQKGSYSYIYVTPNSSQIASVIISPGPDGDLDLPDELWPFVSMVGVSPDLVPPQQASLSAVLGIALPPRETHAAMTEAQAAILNTYVNLAQYSPDKGNDGDIVTVIRY